MRITPQSSPFNSTHYQVIPTTWRPYSDRRFCDVTSPYVYAQHKIRPVVTVVAWSVCLSVCRSICLPVCRLGTLVSPAKTAEPIEVPLGVLTWLGSTNDVLAGVADLPREEVHLRALPGCDSQRHTAMRPARVTVAVTTCSSIA